MNITAIMISVLCIGGVGLFIGIFLGIAGNHFRVDTDPREDEILSVLPGINCGGCGYAGCASLAAAIVTGKAPLNGCPVGGNEVAKGVVGHGEDSGDVLPNNVSWTALVADSHELACKVAPVILHSFP